MKAIITLILLFLINMSFFAQVKIGDTPNVIDTNSILELESKNKVLVITRVSTLEMNAITPLRGALVYNTDEQCVFAYDGTSWKSLCKDSSSGSILTANNGLTISSTKNLQLGGKLVKPTTVQTDATNTLALTGLETGDITQDDIVTVNKTTGQLKEVTATNLVRKRVKKITAVDGQRLFSPPLSITDDQKINVYRNGVRIDFTVLNTTTIEIESEAICYLDDEIRIVQFY